ncbi:MAG: HEAT repeat domain-containing protein [Deltaproteobacteria bacterium]|nr:HEAT repeat domain-containing protein [Deltaproteobacteria bacterium]
MQTTNRPETRWQGPRRIRPKLVVSLMSALAAMGLHQTAHAAPRGWQPLVDPPMSKIQKKRYQVLRRVVRDRNALVNVQAGLVPATPDLTYLGKKALPALEWALTNNTNGSIRQRVAQVLLANADYHSHSALLAATKDWAASVRTIAIKALATMGGPGTEQALTRVMKDKNESAWVRAAAIRGLGRISAKGAFVPLMSMFLNRKKPYRLRRASLYGLWDMRLVLPARSLRRILIEALNEKNPSSFSQFAAAAASTLKDRSPDLRAALVRRLNGSQSYVTNVVAYALGEIGDPKAIGALHKRLSTVRSTRLLNNVIFALGKLKDPALVSLLTGLLHRRQAIIRLNAAFVMGDLKDRRFLPALLKAVSDPSRAVQASALQALAKIGDKQAIPALERAAQSKSIALQLMAYTALNTMTKGRYSDRIVAKFLHRPQTYLRCAGALLLAKQGDSRALVPLMRCRGAYVNDARLVRALSKYPNWRKVGFLMAATTHRLMSSWRAPSALLRGLSRIPLTNGQRRVIRSIAPTLWAKRHARRSIIQFLGQQQDRPATPLFWRTLQSRNVPTRYAAAYALANLGYRQGSSRLTVALTQAAPRVKRTLAHLLRRIKNPKSSASIHRAVKSALSGHGTFTTLAAAYVLTAWEPATGVKVLANHLKDHRQSVRAEAAYYLTRKSLRPYRKQIEALLRQERQPMLRSMLQRVVQLNYKGNVFNPRFVQQSNLAF